MLPVSAIDPLKEYRKKVRAIHSRDLERGFGGVYLPPSLVREYPNTPSD